MIPSMSSRLKTPEKFGLGIMWKCQWMGEVEVSRIQVKSQ